MRRLAWICVAAISSIAACHSGSEDPSTPTERACLAGPGRFPNAVDDDMDRKSGDWFSPPTNYAVGLVSMTTFASGDLDGDGRADVVVLSDPMSAMGVFRSKGDGTFLPMLEYAVGSGPQAVVLADVDRDGHLDAITANVRGRNLSVLLGRGDGSFAAARTLPIGQGVYGLEVADMNGDAVPDLVIAATSISAVGVMLGKGDGNFETPRYFTAGSMPMRIAVGDVDGDDRIDVIVATRGEVSFFRGRGDGTLAPRDMLVGEGCVFSIALADLDSDGRLDFVLADDGGVHISFGEPARPIDAWPRVTWSERLVVRVAKVGIDRKTVLLASDSWTAGIEELRPNGRESIERIAASSAGGLDAITADIDGDGRPDLLARVPSAGAASLEMFVALHRGGGFDTPKTFGAGDFATGFALGDVDGDGRVDVVAKSVRGWNVWRGQKGGALLPPIVTAADTKDKLWVVRAATFDGDGRADLATIDASSKIAVWRGNADATLTKTLTLTIEPGRQAGALAVADLDRDGHLDLVVGFIDPTPAIAVLRGLGDGTFRAPLHTDSLVPGGVTVADLDGNGNLDVLRGSGHAVEVLLGKGDGTFAPSTITPIVNEKSYLGEVLVADVDGDGHKDVIALGASGGGGALLFGRGDAGFARQQYLSFRDGPSLVRDIDGDGHVDVLSFTSIIDGPQPSYEYPMGIVLALGRGDGTFFEVVARRTWKPMLVGAFSDLDGDGRIDLVTSNAQGDLSVFSGMK